MLVVIRADASYTIGSGHIMRCLTLAERLRSKGAEVSFICRDFQGNLADYIESKGFGVYLLPRIKEGQLTQDNSEMFWLGTDWETDANETISVLKKYSNKINWVIVDHYGIDYKWQCKIRTMVSNIMVIDDIANRKHNCEILLDQNLFEHPSLRYSDLVSQRCKLLLGPQYALLRSEFRDARLYSPQRDGHVQQLMIFFGSSDLANETLRTIQAIQSLPLNIDIIVGRINPNLKKIEDFVSKDKNMKMYCDVDDMAQFMLKADLSIGASGSVSWERCCVGLPSIIISIADNQENIAKSLEKYNSAIYLGRSSDVSSSDIINAVQTMMQTPSKVRELSQNACRLVDGLGAERVSDMILSN